MKSSDRARRVAALLLALPLLLPACQCSERPVETASPDTPQVPDGPPPDDARQPAELAQEWDTVRRAPYDDRGRLGQTLADGWQNRRYTWTGYALASLCVDARRMCAINPWERNTTPALEGVRGQSPEFVFTPAAYDRLRTTCAGKPGCVIRAQGTLSEVESDPIEPLRLVFTDVELLEARDPAEGERWFGRAPDAKKPPKKGELVLPPDKRPPLTNIPTVKPRVFRAPAGAAPALPTETAPALPTEAAPALPTETPPAPPAPPPAKP